MCACVAIQTTTGVRVVSVLAFGAVHTRVGFAFVQVYRKKANSDRREIRSSPVHKGAATGAEYNVKRLVRYIVGAHGGRSGHLVLFLVALLFSKLQTFINNNSEGNPLKSVYLTPKIALKFRRIGCRNGRLVTIAICFSHSLFRATKLVFMANYSYCRGA